MGLFTKSKKTQDLNNINDTSFSTTNSINTINSLTSNQSNSTIASKKKISRNDIKINQIGDGVSGKVDLYRSRSSPDFKYAVKTYHSKEMYESKSEYKDRVLYEYNTLHNLHHENIIQVYKYDVSLNGNTIKTFMEAGSPNLYDLIKHVPVSKLDPLGMLCIWKQICQGIRYLHLQDICHRDLKLDNLIVDIPNRTVKIIDLVTAADVHNNQLAIGLVGSPSYFAPETLERIRYDGKKADIWSLGIILYYLLNKKFPWKQAKIQDERYKAFLSLNPNYLSSSSDLPPPILNESGYEIGKPSVLRYLPSESWPLTSQIFESDPEKRCGIEEFFTNDWFTNIKYCHSDIRCGINHTIVFKDHENA
ncbi:kinase-like domain-containing protein [Scheffersomyces coipomensis]|uniref:kinase-like domain-containing protein n=1 Tax=Scheffersomyces coipomensis TaxID=1788519 RepID=UPI00315CA5D0